MISTPNAAALLAFPYLTCASVCVTPMVSLFPSVCLEKFMSAGRGWPKVI